MGLVGQSLGGFFVFADLVVVWLGVPIFDVAFPSRVVGFPCMIFKRMLKVKEGYAAEELAARARKPLNGIIHDEFFSGGSVQ